MLEIARLSVGFVLLGALAFAACGDNGDDGDDEHDGYDTYQMCWDEHHTTEMFPAPMAIAICCLNQPIGTQVAGVVCGDTAANCEAYVSSNVGADATAADITAGCAEYISQRGL